ncbi:Rap1a/Tai family immunity protein [Massilia sp. W12]|uniref:Rap1a/Tai family immunity protein n=1 Tax=Massilia sp. W12 TaxID=3126507 RepID=UPI0030D598E7
MAGLVLRRVLELNCAAVKQKKQRPAGRCFLLSKSFVRTEMRIFCLFAILLFCGAAQGETRLARPIAEQQRLNIENNNLTTEEFLSAYMSKNIMERRYAEMFLLGVMEAGEGRDWCDYRKFKTVTVNEEIYSGLQGLSMGQRKERAASILISILRKQFPCKGKNK